MWFFRMIWFNETDCADVQLNEHASVNDFDPSEKADMTRWVDTSRSVLKLAGQGNEAYGSLLLGRSRLPCGL